jgi:putative Mn2+ efflux pump MntP
MGIATSIDALVIGLNLALLGVEIAIPSLVIGVVCFTASIFGVYLGARLGTKLRFKTQWIGGLILIGLGVKILIEHLYIS